MRSAFALLAAVLVLTGCARGVRGFSEGVDPSVPEMDSGPSVIVTPDASMPVVDSSVPEADAAVIVPDASTPEDDAGVPPIPTTSVAIVAVSATVADFKVNGDDWDLFGDAPDVSFDLDYALSTKAPKRATSKAINSFTPRWNADLITGLSEADVALIGIAVWDEDSNEALPSNDDAVGACTFAVSQAMIDAGPLTFDCPRNNADPDQSGYSITLDFQRR